MFEGFLREDNSITGNRTKVQHNYIKNYISQFIYSDGRETEALIALYFLCGLSALLLLPEVNWLLFICLCRLMWNIYRIILSVCNDNILRKNTNFSGLLHYCSWSCVHCYTWHFFPLFRKTSGTYAYKRKM